MKSTVAAAALLALTSTASAFAPTANTFVAKAPTKLFAEAEKEEMVLDTNFDDVNLARLLGLRRVKKIIRKKKSQRNKAAEKEN
mmetsp:Transcript_22311/g.27352  ORF Transcript_22311/g.27352 Transcript_22311/m.27352 type:complete len:84 (+) Transcript_22311:78-329(+)